jgi:two-component system cell cycle response regulator
MSARVLVVDDVPFNEKLLRAQLTKEYYEVISAHNGRVAVDMTKQYLPDIILMDVMMPEMDGVQATQIIRSDPETAHIPIIMVTALNAIEDRVKGLQAGADDFLTKPINEQALMARLKSLLRMKMMMDELRLRNKTSQDFGVAQPLSMNINTQGRKILLVDDDLVQRRQTKEKLVLNSWIVDECPNPQSLEEVLSMASAKDYSLIIISTEMVDVDGLRLSSMIRSHADLRYTPILITVAQERQDILMRGLEMGVNDYIATPFDSNELIVRCTTQIRNKIFQDMLKASYLDSLSLSVRDGLTNVFNRRYFDSHISNLLEKSKAEGRALSLMMIDIDHFKPVNDNYGHPSGDAILKQVAGRMLASVRAVDLVTRYGGEEFAIIMPETDAAGALVVAERVRQAVEQAPFTIPVAPGQLQCTVSIGCSQLSMQDTMPSLIARADQNLYQAKQGGRNKVVIDTPVSPPPAPAPTPTPPSAPVQPV